MDYSPNFHIQKKDHFGFDGVNAAKGTGAYKQKSYCTVIGGVPGWDASIRPEGGKQRLTLYHYYNDDPRFPEDYCKVGVISTFFDNVLKMTEGTNGNWSTSSSVEKLFTWVHAKETASGYRGTLQGDVVVEENGAAWRLLEHGWYFMGKYPGYAL
ncbi:Uncharacterized protein QTN25_005739 [Entamoeba marina]